MLARMMGLILSNEMEGDYSEDKLDELSRVIGCREKCQDCWLEWLRTARNNCSRITSSGCFVVKQSRSEALRQKYILLIMLFSW